MKVIELVIGIAFTLGGLRSIWYWGRRHFDGTDVVDHLLYALYLTGRIGMWFAFAGFFFIYAAVDVQGRAALDDLEAFRWYLLVPLILGGMQLIGGWFLGRRMPAGERET